MSENIQSIANGSFVLGNTNELTFSAGPGIKIDQPSEGVVRIGNDETVLYSGAYTMNTFPAVTVNEPIWNFERIKVTVGTDKVSTGFRGVYSEEFFIDDLRSINFLLFQPYTFNGNTLNAVYPHIIAYSGTSDGLTFNPYYAGYHNQSYSGTAAGINKQVTLQGGRFNTTGASTYEMGITRIIGINRISGSNA